DTTSPPFFVLTENNQPFVSYRSALSTTTDSSSRLTLPADLVPRLRAPQAVISSRLQSLDDFAKLLYTRHLLNLHVGITMNGILDTKLVPSPWVPSKTRRLTT
ncbi:hypothetical protein FRC15_007096, partial [Serendipita sp. 397]